MCDDSRKISNKKGVKIINPYLKKKKPQPSQTSINSFLFLNKTDAKDKEGNCDVENHNSKFSTSVGPLASDAQIADESLIDPPPNSTTKGNPVSNLSTHKQDLGQEISIEQRLPSRMVSFGCAEHLSVTELREFLRYYTDRSVRVTGIILHRNVVEADASVCLVVGDPLTQRPHTKKSSVDSSGNIAPKSLDQSTSTSAVTPKKFSDTKATLGPTRTPSIRKPSIKRAPLSSRGSSGLKRRLVHKAKTPGSSSLLGRKNHKRRLSFSTPTEAATDCLVSRNDSILAILNPLHHPEIADCGVGDLIMLIGEIILIPSDEEPTIAAPFVTQYRTKIQDKAARYLVPRILRNVNGTDVRLQYEAILRRREHVLRISNGNPTQPGRGPPRLKEPSLATS